MSTIQPASARHQADLVGDQLKIRIPSRKDWFQIPFLVFWLVFWFFGWVSAASTLFTAPFGVDMFMLIWLTFWSIGGVLAFTTLFWLVMGEERVEISYEVFCIKRHILGMGQTKSYDLAYLKDLRVTSHSTSHSFWNSRRNSNLTTFWKMDGPITFDYGAKTIRFGDGVDEAEAKQIVKLIQQYFPKLA